MANVRADLEQLAATMYAERVQSGQHNGDNKARSGATTVPAWAPTMIAKELFGPAFTNRAPAALIALQAACTGIGFDTSFVQAIGALHEVPENVFRDNVVDIPCSLGTFIKLVNMVNSNLGVDFRAHVLQFVCLDQHTLKAVSSMIDDDLAYYMDHRMSCLLLNVMVRALLDADRSVSVDIAAFLFDCRLAGVPPFMYGASARETLQYLDAACHVQANHVRIYGRPAH